MLGRNHGAQLGGECIELIVERHEIKIHGGDTEETN
jgi:hypothetical protein